MVLLSCSLRFWEGLEIFDWVAVTIERRLDKVMLTEFKEEGVVVSFIGSVASTEDKHLIFLYLAG